MADTPAPGISEGGGALPAFGEDFLQRITGVHWPKKIAPGGAVFVYGEVEGNNLHYVYFKNTADSNPKIQTITLPEPPLISQDVAGDRFTISGSSFAFIGDISKPDVKPTSVFLVIGVHGTIEYRTDLSLFHNYHPKIYRSEDGLSWSVAYTELTSNTSTMGGTEVVGINNGAVVWDPASKAFYYDQNKAGGGAGILDQIFSSSDGSNWGMISQTDTGGNPSYQSSFLQYCEHNNCIDETGQHVPDGVMWQDSVIALNGKNRTIVRPVNPPVVFYSESYVRFYPGNSTVYIERNDIRTSNSVSISGIGCVTCAAAANGVLMAGGYNPGTDYLDPGAVAYSLDGGTTWKLLGSTPIGVATMVAMPT